MIGRGTKYVQQKGGSPRSTSSSPRPGRVNASSGRTWIKITSGVLSLLYIAILVLIATAVLLKPYHCSSVEKEAEVPLGGWPPAGGSAEAQLTDEDGLEERLYPPISSGPRKFLLYRLIGNDMPPLQCKGQLLLNTGYTLEHEAREFPECRKIWVLNNIVNDTERAALTDLLLSHGYPLEDIIDRQVNYEKLAKAKPEKWTGMVTAQNEARNFMLEHGMKQPGVRWVLPFDGNQFFTNEAWDDIRRASMRYEQEGLKYFKVPMYRLYREQKAEWLRDGTQFPSLKDYAPFMWESQIAFRNDSTERYNQDLEYGKDNKLEFIDRVCGTGKFDPEGKGKDAEGVADRKQCGCHRDVGNDRKVRDFNPAVARKCGYSVRLWYYPCAGVRRSIIFTNPAYRRKLRKEGYESLKADIWTEMEKWIEEVGKLADHKKPISARLHVDPHEALKLKNMAVQKVAKLKPKKKWKSKTRYRLKGIE